MLKCSRIDRCGAFRSLYGSLRRAVNIWHDVGLSRPAAAPLRSACSTGLPPHQRRCIHNEPSASPSAVQRELREDAADSRAERSPVVAEAPARGPRVEWPADIVERARRELSSGRSTHSPSLQGHHGGPPSEPSSFISLAELQQQLQPNDIRAFWRRVRRAISQPLSGAAAAADPSFGALDGAPRGTDSCPIVYKRYIDGMVAAHHYPSRLLPPRQAMKLPPLFFVTPFALREDAGASAQAQEQRLRERVLRTNSPGERLPKISVLACVQLVERLYGRVSLLFLFDVGGQHSQLADVSAWLRHLERHSAFISSVYGPAFASSAAAAASSAAAGSLPPGLMQQLFSGLGWRPEGMGPELASVQYICVDHAPFWLRSLAVRSMQSLTPAFRPLSPFHSFPHRLHNAARMQKKPPEGPHDPLQEPQGDPRGPREAALRLLAEEYEHLCSLIRNRGVGSSLIGSFLAYSGRWGPEEVAVFKRKERSKFVSVLLVDKAARVRWHATGSPTEEAVLLLL
ncbi:hypothetical protein, conserved [Eimeria brunetti]|uniref:Uncharacterized protein n=1 Tax=Eimeria brunetti TaxID=51314 RepID=U6LRT7_9EIME|nr:hypothetical protein, conserved [Eimeria brunetti]